MEKIREIIVFTNGIFDLLHVGHINLLEFAKSLGDKLIVGINSDNAARKLKGENRPINNEQDRKKILESLKMVDEVIIFDDIKTKNLLREIKPDILVKGSEFSPEEIRRRDEVSNEIEIRTCPLINGKSTTKIIRKIHSSASP